MQGISVSYAKEHHMTPIRLARIAWAGAIVGAASGLLYLLYTPIPSSHTTDTLVAIGVASVGAVVGAVLQSRLENPIGSS